jgi:hypothetical protein
LAAGTGRGLPVAAGRRWGSPRSRLECRPMSKRTVKRKLRAKKKANHGKRPNCGRG